MKQVIGHRGAAGLALENTRAAIKKGLALGASMLEIDVRRSHDGVLLLCHDPDLERIAGDKRRVADLNWAELRQIELRDGNHLISLVDVLKLVGSQPMMIEMKVGGTADELLAVLDKFPDGNFSIASFKRNLLIELRKLRPGLSLYVLEHHNVFDAVQFARRHRLQGIGLNFWLLHPLAYHAARRAEVKIYLYTVNHRFLAWFLRLLYPTATICTDHPERFV